MKLKEHIEKFDETLDESKKDSSKSQLKEYIEKFDESLGEPLEESSIPYSYTPTNEKLTQFAPVEQLQREIQQRDKIIENLLNESTELKKQISTVEKNESTILKELEKSKWLENKVTLATKKVYEDKIQSVINENIDSKIIPILTGVARRKQGNQQLNWGNWLKIPENKYLFQVNKDVAKGIFEDTNNLIERRLDNESIRGGGSITTTSIYGLSFDGLTQSVDTTFGGSSASPADRTYSWWMKATETGQNLGVFGYGSTKREAFLVNVSQNSMGKPKFAFATHMYKFFMTEDHEEEGGGSTGDADSGAIESTAHIEAQDDGQWHHWMVFSDVSAHENDKLYIDAVEQDTAKFANTGTNNTQQDSLTIGAVDSGTTNSEHFEGSITNFAVFSGDITVNASAHYNSGIPNKDLSGESNLEGYWKMDENSGTAVADSSGNGNDGTITNGAEWITVMEIVS